jgi:hypothetical protein
MRRHKTDPSALIAGIVFMAVGLIALSASRSHLVDALGWIWSSVALGLGVALLVRPRWDTASAGEDGPSHEVGAERGEDREVQEAGGGHDG